MATVNPFDLLGDDDAEDPSQLIAAHQKLSPKKALAPTQPKDSAPQAAAKQAKLPSKPLPPAQALREAKNEDARGGRGGGRGFGRGRGAGGFNRDSNESSFSNSGSFGQGAPEDRDTGNPSERRGYAGYRASRGGGGGGGGGRRGGFNGGDGNEERPRRVYERHSGTGRGNDPKREGAGRGNWGTQNDEYAEATVEVLNDSEKTLPVDKPVGEEDVVDGNKDNLVNEPEEKEPENKEMTLEEYEKVLEEKRKALQALKTEERKVDTKEFESMQQISNKKKNTDDIFIKLGSDKDKRKEVAEKEEKSKKPVSINEFLKPADGERNYNSGGRGRGRGRGSRGGYGGGNVPSNSSAPSIKDPDQFPTLGGK